MKKFIMFLFGTIMVVGLAGCKTVNNNGGEIVRNPMDFQPETVTTRESVVEETSEEYPENLGSGQVHYMLVEIEPQCKPAMGFSFELPSGWSYEVTQTEDVPTSCVSVRLRPDSTDLKGDIIIECTEGFGVCGTGLRLEETDFNGHEASMGFYDGKTMWDFIVLKGDNQNCVILNSAEWYEDYKEYVENLLSTVQFRYYEE